MIKYITVGFIALLTVITGCSGTSPDYQGTLLDRNWGRSYEAAKFSQIMNPDVGKNREPVLGLDGQPAEYGIDNYKNSFREKKTQEITNIIKLR
ncbi:MAG: hypothetical protein PVH53_17525 [Desulfobacterales bacterium]|jgi:hypothetical protein